MCKVSQVEIKLICAKMVQVYQEEKWCQSSGLWKAIAVVRTWNTHSVSCCASLSAFN